MTEIVYQKRLLTVADYLEMGRQGILRSDERVELIHGEIVVMAPQGPVHASCVRRLNTLFSRRIFEHGAEVAEVSVQLPLVASEHDAPEPDVALLRIADYANRHPEGNDVLLAVEVAVTTLSYDREIKVPMFARAGIPEVWIVNYEDQVLEVYRDPRDGRYEERFVSLADEDISIEALPALGLFKVVDILA
jgi:Uma2 family endonuclease